MLCVSALVTVPMRIYFDIHKFKDKKNNVFLRKQRKFINKKLNDFTVSLG